MSMSISIPRRLFDEFAKRGINIESYVIDLLTKMFNLDPMVSVESHLELSAKYLDEGRMLIDKDPVQAFEKLYKAAEEVVKALTIYFNLSDIMEKVNERNGWTITELDKASRVISGKLGKWFRSSWDTAWALHVWGFHEAKLDSESVRDRLPDIEKMIIEAQKIVKRKD
jgi:hypothetical protein